jgi:hypothetical protein
MRSAGGLNVLNVKECRNFMTSRLKLCFIFLSGFVLLLNLNAYFLLIMVIAVLMN